MFHEYGHIADLGHYLQQPDMKNQVPGKKFLLNYKLSTNQQILSLVTQLNCGN